MQARLAYTETQLKAASKQPALRSPPPPPPGAPVAAAGSGRHSGQWTLGNHLPACLAAAVVGELEASKDGGGLGGGALAAGLAAHLAAHLERVKASQALAPGVATAVCTPAVGGWIASGGGSEEVAALRRQLAAVSTSEKTAKAELRRQRAAVEQHMHVRATLETLLGNSTAEASECATKKMRDGMWGRVDQSLWCCG